MTTKVKRRRKPKGAPSEFLQATQGGAKPKAVDRGNNIIRGFIVASLGEFKSGRGIFDEDSLKEIAKHGNASNNGRGLRVGWKHPSASGDQLGSHLGRARNFRVDGDDVRADMHLADVSMKPHPEGGGKPIGEYVLDLAEEDPEAFGASLVIHPKEMGVDRNGEISEYTQKKHGGQTPIWRVDSLRSVDVVAFGDATDKFLSDPEFKLTSQVVGTLQSYFSELTREEAELRMQDFIGRYLSETYPAEEEPDMADANAITSDDLEKRLSEHGDKLLSQVKGLFDDERKARKEERDADKAEREAMLSDQKRIEEVTAVCKQLGWNDRLDEFLSKKTPAGEVYKLHFEEVTKNGGGSKTADPPSDPNSEANLKKLRAEFEQDKEYGDPDMKFEQYLSLRKKADVADSGKEEKLSLEDRLIPSGVSANPIL